MIYLDNAATTNRKPKCVAEAVVAAMNSFGNSGRSVHESSLSASRTVYGAREALARLFACPKASNVIFTQNSTEALNIAILGLFSPGDHIISTDLEHNSVLRPLYELQRRGAEVSFVPADRNGCIDCADFEKLIKPNTKGIVCTHASNLLGNLVDIESVGKIAKSHGLTFVVDASQSAGERRISMKESNIDVLCFTGHKALLGPQGVGGMCIAEGVDIRPLKSGGTGVQTYLERQPDEYPTRLEAGTLNSHGIAGLLASLGFIEEVGIEKIHDKVTGLMRRFYEAVREIPGVTVYGDFSGDRAPIVSLNIKDIPSADAADILAEDFDICVRPGAHCAPRLHKALGTVEQGAVRFSFGFYTEESDVDAAIEAVRSIADED